MDDTRFGEGALQRILTALVVAGTAWFATSVAAAPITAEQVAEGRAPITYQIPAPELVAIVDAPVAPAVSLSPDRKHLVLMERAGLPTIVELSEPELRLAGLRIDPRTNGPSRSRPYRGLAFRSLEGVERPVTGLPAEPRLRHPRWSPDSRSIAFTHDAQDHIELWVADVETARARRLSEVSVSDASIGSPYTWLPDAKSLIVRAVPADRGDPPAATAAPSGPVARETSGGAAAARTYQDLLRDPHDAALFEYYATSVLWRVSLDGEAALFGGHAIYGGVRPSPDGRYLLIQTTHEPFSYLVPVSRFPKRIEVWDTDGNVVEDVAHVPLQEAVPAASESVPTGVREIDWRDDADATLYWVEALDRNPGATHVARGERGGDAGGTAAARDRLLMLEAPFDGEPITIATLPFRYDGVQWAAEGFGLLHERWGPTRTRRVYRINPARPGEKTVLFEYSDEDRYNDPGTPVTRLTRRGTSLLLTADGGCAIFLIGAGASPEGERPFLHLFNILSGETEELFRSEAPYYEIPIEVIDADRGMLLTRRESNNEPPNYFVRDLSTGDVTAVTGFPHPYPELDNVRIESMEYERADGVALSARLYLPPGYDAERDGPLPTFLWAYPREYKSAEAAEQRIASPHQFKTVPYSGPVPFVLQGYAVIDGAAMPIIGEGDNEPNDSFIEQLVQSARAVIEEGVRLGVVDANRVAVGGHSYGAFMTANLLAHSDLFRAGIARSGAYNRTLTPFGFQSEDRTFWDAPEVYMEMSPFNHADKVDEPILLIHGEADNNAGTFPMQSERFFAALKGLGHTARLVLLPDESHGYAARESILHMLWEEGRWLDTHLKSAPRRGGHVTTTNAPSEH
ncbi:MAG: S9 family peptidase [Longimicrobiales bacterium]